MSDVVGVVAFAAPVAEKVTAEASAATPRIAALAWGIGEAVMRMSAPIIARDGAAQGGNTAATADRMHQLSRQHLLSPSDATPQAKVPSSLTPAPSGGDGPDGDVGLESMVDAARGAAAMLSGSYATAPSAQTQARTYANTAVEILQQFLQGGKSVYTTPPAAGSFANVVAAVRPTDVVDVTGLVQPAAGVAEKAMSQASSMAPRVMATAMGVGDATLRAFTPIVTRGVVQGGGSARTADLMHQLAATADRRPELLAPHVPSLQAKAPLPTAQLAAADDAEDEADLSAVTMALQHAMTMVKDAYATTSTQEHARAYADAVLTVSRSMPFFA